MSIDLKEKTEKILARVELPDRHTFFQIEKFIIGKEVTAQSQMWAIVREIRVRNETIEAFDKDLRDAEDNLELLDLKIERLNRQMRAKNSPEDGDSDLFSQECEINIRKLLREKESLIKSARRVKDKKKAVEEEMEFLTQAFDKVEAQHGPMKSLDDEQSQREMWSEKFLEEFNLRVILQRPLDPEFVRSVLCLHDEAPVKKHVIALIDQIQQKMLQEKKSRAKPEITVNPQAVGA